MAANYSLDTGAGAWESSTDNGISTFSADDAAAAEGTRSTDSAKIIYTANLSLESKDYDAARAALDAAEAAAQACRSVSRRKTTKASLRLWPRLAT